MDGNRTAWTEEGFDDSAWKSNEGSRAQFGAKNGAIGDLGDGITPAVLLNQYINGESGDDIPAFFFRTTFTLDAIPEDMELQGSVIYDDAAVIYINGEEAAAFDVPENGYDSNLSYGGSNASTPKSATFTADTSMLKTGTNTIAVELHQGRASSSDIYFEMTSLAFAEQTEETPDALTQKSVSLTVGSDSLSRNITWYADSPDPGTVQYAPKSGEEFPETYSEAQASVEAANDQGFYSNQAVMTGLEPDTEYVYRLVNRETVSQTYSFKTGGTGNFSFLLAGDPQIGAGSLESDIQGWENTLNVAAAQFPDASFLVSVGDQVNSAADEGQYSGYLEHAALKGLTTATVIGNHDTGSSSYSQHFNNPNESQYGATAAGSDYWYVYNNVLFMNLNTNNMSTAEHKAFMEDAIQKNQDVDWKVVVLHHSLYSVASHATEDDILQRRNELVPVFQDLDIDVVLQGHDHVYVRSYMMNGLTPEVTDTVESSVTDPEGILYVTVNSASGSKFYTIQNDTFDYAAVKSQERIPNISYVEVSENSFRITTYRTSDMSVVDSFKIQRDSDVAEIEGDGSQENPYMLDSDADLREMAARLNADDPDWVGKNYALNSDIQMKSDSFPMIDSFNGILDGNGHTIYGLTIDEPEAVLDGRTEHRVAFIRTNTGTVQNLNFENASVKTLVNSGANSYCGAAVVVGENATGGLISRIQVKNSTVTAPGLGKAAGIAALNGRNLSAAASIQDCRFDGSISCGGNTAYGAMMGGITAYSAGSQTLIKNCYAEADMTYTGTGADVIVSAAVICGYPNALTLQANVAGEGSIEFPSNVTTANVGRIYGLYNTSYHVKTGDNLANETIFFNGSPIVSEDSARDQATNGTGVTADELSQQETYTEIGWDFRDCWKMGTDNRPELKEPGALTLEGSGVAEDPFRIGTEEDLRYVTELLNRNDGRVTGKYFVLTDDIVLTENFPMIDRFSGVLDGAGHSISGLRIIDTDTGTRRDYLVGFVRVNSGTIKDLAFESPVVETSVVCNTDSFSGVAVIAGENANGGLIHGCRVSNATVSAPNAAKAAGITAMNGRNNQNTATVSNCYVSGDFSCGGTAVSFGSMMGGIAAYSSTSTIRNCITDVNLTCDTAGISTAIVSQSPIVGYINAVTLEGNVAYGGTMTAAGDITARGAGGLYGTIAASSGRNTFSDNLTCEEVTIDGNAVTAGEQNGDLTGKEALQTKETYIDLGWRFDLEWEMTADKYPIPRPFSYPDEAITRVTAAPAGDGIGFSWYSKEEGDSYVSISTKEDMSSPQTIAASGSSNETGFRYTAKAEGLDADTAYYYQVCTGGDVSETGTFRTAPESGAFTFINLAGTDGSDLNDASVAADTMKVALDTRQDASFILHSGSMVDASRGDEAWKELFFNAQDTFLSTLYAPAVGNEGTQTVTGQFNIGETGYYSFDYSNTHIAVLNTSENAEQCVSEEQIQWLKDDVADARARGAEWIIVSLDKGPYTTGSTADAPEVAGLRTVLLPVIDELGIDLVLQGQDHILGRTYSIKDGTADKSEYMEMVNGKRFYYSLSDDGTVYFMPGQAGVNMDTQVTEMTTEDLDTYLSLFSRSEQRGSASNPTQTFAAVTVDGDKLTVCTYERKNTDTATMIEAFGIDHAVGKVEQLIQDGRWEEAREAYDLLTDAQQGAVENYYLLLQAENEELQEDKGAWLDTEAEERRSIILRNDTFSSFSDAPVRLEIENAPSETMKFYTTRGEEIPSDIESYDADGTSIVWVKVPVIEANAVTGLWVYFGGSASELSSENVWSNQYALVEHFADISGDVLEDSTGKAVGMVTGELTESDKGADQGAHFSDSKITYGSIGDDYDAFTVSAIVSMTDEDMEALGGGKGVIAAKFLSTDHDTNAYQMSVNSASGQLDASYYAKWWREHNYDTSSWPTDQKTDYTNDINITDGNQHMVTLMYDGLTVSLYIDGVAVQKGRVFLENSIYTDESLPTVIGAYSDEELAGAFAGTIYEVQISGAGTSEQWESFRYSAYFGDAVTIGQPEKNGDLAVNADVVGRSATLEAGDHLVQGLLSRAADLTVKVGDKKYDLGHLEAGMFTETLTMTGSGDKEVTITAQADGETASCSVTIHLGDSKTPDIAGTDTVVSEDGQTLVVDPDESADETLTTDFYLSDAITLSEENMEVASGSTTENTPDSIDPMTCGYAVQELSNMTTATEDGTKPYQIYKISLTEEQIAEGKYHIGWYGASDRQIHAYAYDQEAGKWVKTASTSGSGNLSMDIEVDGSQYTKDGHLYLLFFRGLGTEPEDMGSYTPGDGQYDFSMSWTSDVQYTSEFYEDILLQQKKWIADTYDDYKSVMNVDTGDVANAAYLSWEYNWKTVDKAYEVLENAEIPYTIAWGNHDYKYVDKYNLIPNSDRLYRQYFPLSRFEENLGGWELVSNHNETDDMCLTQTIHGSKIMLLTLSYWMDESDIEWAKGIVTDPQYADYNIIILTHHFNSGGRITSSLGQRLLSEVIQGNENVKLLLCGHVDGVDVINPTTGGQQFYSILQDYQDESGNMIYGGNGFLRMINFDVENGLIYFNTYCPLTGETETPWADGSYQQIDGLYQKNRDEFAVAVDLGGNQERTFTTTSLSLSSGEAEKAGTVITAGNETITFKPQNLTAGQGYAWYAVTTDSAGNTTVTAQRSFTAVSEAGEPTVVGIEIAKQPNLTDYVEGEVFNPEGMVVNAIYSDGSRIEITDYTVEPAGPLTVEDTAAVISWNGMTAQVVISVRSGSSETPVITGIEITTAPERTEYKTGEVFDPEGMVVSAVYSDGRRQVVEDYTYTPNGALTADDTAITVSWNGMTAELSISVTDDAEPDHGGDGTADKPSSGNESEGNGAAGEGGNTSGGDQGDSGASSGGNAAATGDPTVTAVWPVLICASLAGVLVLLRKRKAE